MVRKTNFFKDVINNCITEDLISYKTINLSQYSIHTFYIFDVEVQLYINEKAKSGWLEFKTSFPVILSATFINKILELDMNVELSATTFFKERRYYIKIFFGSNGNTDIPFLNNFKSICQK